jgi:hypothetical protein
MGPLCHPSVQLPETPLELHAAQTRRVPGYKYLPILRSIAACRIARLS